MRTLLTMVGCLVLAAWPSHAGAQGTAAPTRKAASSTPAEEAKLRQGVALHDQGQYDEAVAVYDAILADNPDNMNALFEKAYSLSEKKDYPQSLQAARRGTEYQSDQLPMFYDLLGSNLDAMGEPQKAIDAYRQGLAIVPKASMLYFNMAVTYLESLKNPDEARRALERAATIDPLQSDTHLMLGRVFEQGGYPVPGLLAFSTFLIFEPGGPQSLQAYGFWRSLLRAGVPMGQTDNGDAITRDRAMPAPKGPAAKVDEGDFADVDAQLAPAQRAFLSEVNGGTEEVEALVSQVDHIFAVLESRDPKRDRGTLAGTLYLPYFAELKRKNFVEPFVYWAIQRAPVAGVREWLTSNQARVREFLDWTRAYPWPKS